MVSSCQEVANLDTFERITFAQNILDSAVNEVVEPGIEGSLV